MNYVLYRKYHIFYVADAENGKKIKIWLALQSFKTENENFHSEQLHLQSAKCVLF